MSKKLEPIHPGEILLQEFILPYFLSHTKRLMGISSRVMEEIVSGQRGISKAVAAKLSEYYGNTTGFWMGLQATYDTRKKAKRKRK